MLFNHDTESRISLRKGAKQAPQDWVVDENMPEASEDLETIDSPIAPNNFDELPLDEWEEFAENFDFEKSFDLPSLRTAQEFEVPVDMRKKSVEVVLGPKLDTPFDFSSVLPPADHFKNIYRLKDPQQKEAFFKQQSQSLETALSFVNSPIPANKYGVVIEFAMYFLQTRDQNSDEALYFVTSFLQTTLHFQPQNLKANYESFVSFMCTHSMMLMKFESTDLVTTFWRLTGELMRESRSTELARQILKALANTAFLDNDPALRIRFVKNILLEAENLSILSQTPDSVLGQILNDKNMEQLVVYQVMFGYRKNLKRRQPEFRLSEKAESELDAYLESAPINIVALATFIRPNNAPLFKRMAAFLNDTHNTFRVRYSYASLMVRLFPEATQDDLHIIIPSINNIFMEYISSMKKIARAFHDRSATTFLAPENLFLVRSFLSFLVCFRIYIFVDIKAYNEAKKLLRDIFRYARLRQLSLFSNVHFLGELKNLAAMSLEFDFFWPEIKALPIFDRASDVVMIEQSEDFISMLLRFVSDIDREWFIQVIETLYLEETDLERKMSLLVKLCENVYKTDQYVKEMNLIILTTDLSLLSKSLLTKLMKLAVPTKLSFQSTLKVINTLQETHFADAFSDMIGRVMDSYDTYYKENEEA